MTDNNSGEKQNENQISTADDELLEKVKEEFGRQLKAGKISMKVGDFVKILEIQKKIAVDNDARIKFWELIDKARRKELKND